MQLELALTASPEDTYIASDLGYLLHKNPARVFTRSLSVGTASVFYSEVSDRRCTAILHLRVDPIALVRGKNKQNTGLLDQYVNDRPFVANSLLSVAMNKCYAQSLSGKSKERQELADRALPWSARIAPIACEDAAELVAKLFEPLGYQWHLDSLDASADHGIYSLSLTHTATLSNVLNHLYVLIPVMDNAKHWWVDETEIDTLLAKGGQWLAQHPERTLITKRALKHRRDLSDEMLIRLARLGDSEERVGNLGEGDRTRVASNVRLENTTIADAAANTAAAAAAADAAADAADAADADADADADAAGTCITAVGVIGAESDGHNKLSTSGVASINKQERLAVVEQGKPVRLHDQRLDRVAQILAEQNVKRVLDIGCGEGKLIRRLLKHPGFTEIVGVDPSLRALKKAREAFYLDDAGDGLSERLTFQLGSLTYADRRLRGFDAATLVEVIEHIDTNRLAALRSSLFGDARPSMVIITTPNADYNAMYENLTAGEFRHDDHRFEWSRAQFTQWCEQVADDFNYLFEIEALGPVNEEYGAPSQLVLFTANHTSTITRKGVNNKSENNIGENNKGELA